MYSRFEWRLAERVEEVFLPDGQDSVRLEASEDSASIVDIDSKEAWLSYDGEPAVVEP